MTEREKREKRIEEMENICYGTGHHREMVPDIAKYIFITLDNADYRKADEVRKEADTDAYNVWKAMFGLKEKSIRNEERKETAKEIFKALDEIIDKSEKVNDVLFYGKNFSETGVLHRRFYVYKKDIQTLKEKFGVEVEE